MLCASATSTRAGRQRSPQGNEVWVAPSSGLLTRLDAATGRPVHAVDPNASPAGVDVGDGAVWVTDDQADNVTRVDPTGLLTPIAVGNGPTGIAVGEGGVWVADSFDNRVVSDRPGHAVGERHDPGGALAQLASRSAPASVWVANSGDGTVTRIDPRTDRVLATIRVGGSPQAITVADGRVWVTVDAQTIDQAGGVGGGTLRMGDRVSTLTAWTRPCRTLAGSWPVLYATCAKLFNYPDASGTAGGRS